MYSDYIAVGISFDSKTSHFKKKTDLNGGNSAYFRMLTTKQLVIGCHE
jgi:hypothetical protein